MTVRSTVQLAEMIFEDSAAQLLVERLVMEYSADRLTAKPPGIVATYETHSTDKLVSADSIVTWLDLMSPFDPFRLVAFKLFK